MENKNSEFNVNSIVNKSYKLEHKQDDDGTVKIVRYIEVPVSGLKEDSDGARISQEAIDGMISQYKSGTLPAFNNHGKNGTDLRYGWQDIIGKWVDARQEEDTLYATMQLNDAHPEADKLWSYIQNGIPIGFSIGGNCDDKDMSYEIVEQSEDTNTLIEKSRKRLVYNRLRLRETSVVGIPAYQDAINHSLIKSLKEIKMEENIQEQPTIGEEVKTETIETPKEEVKEEVKTEEPKVEEKIEEQLKEKVVEEKKEETVNTDTVSTPETEKQSSTEQIINFLSKEIGKLVMSKGLVEQDNKNKLNSKSTGELAIECGLFKI